MKNRRRLFLSANEIDADGRLDPCKVFGMGGELVDEVDDGMVSTAMEDGYVRIPEAVVTIDH